MFRNSLIFLLLSNSITLRRDKSILYSRATITLLQYCFNALIFILLSNYIRLRQDKSIFYPTARVTLLQSGFNSFIVKTGFITVTIFCSDSLSFYNDVLYIYNSLIDNFNTINSFNFNKTMNPFALELYNRFVSMSSTNIVELKNFIDSYDSAINFRSFSSIQFRNYILYLHTNIQTNIIFYNMLMVVLVPIGLTAAVNIHIILAFYTKVLKIFSEFFNALIKKCSSFYDVVTGITSTRISLNDKLAEHNSSTNNKTISQSSGSGGGHDDNGDGDRGRQKPSAKPSYGYTITWKEFIRILEFISRAIINLREANQHGYAGYPDDLRYGSLLRGNNVNQIVTLSQIIRYAIDNHNQVVPGLNMPLSSILTFEAKSKILNDNNYLVRGFSWNSVNYALRDYSIIVGLLDEVGSQPNNIMPHIFVDILDLLEEQDIWIKRLG